MHGLTCKNLALECVLSLIMTGIEAACDPNRSTCWTFVDPSRSGQGPHRDDSTVKEAYVPAVGPTRSRSGWVRRPVTGRHVCPRTGALALSIGGSANMLAWLARAQSAPAAGGGEAFTCPRPAPGEPTCRRVDQETHGGLPAILRAVRQWTGIEHPVLRQLRPRRRHGGGRIGSARRGVPRARPARPGGRDATRWPAPGTAGAFGVPRVHGAARVRGAPGPALPGRLGRTGLPVGGLRHPTQFRGAADRTGLSSAGSSGATSAGSRGAAAADSPRTAPGRPLGTTAPWSSRAAGG